MEFFVYKNFIFFFNVIQILIFGPDISVSIFEHSEALPIVTFANIKNLFKYCIKIATLSKICIGDDRAARTTNIHILGE